MSVEENKSIVRRLVQEVVNQRNLKVIDKIVASDCVFRGSGGQEVIGTDIMKQMLATFFDAFDNLHMDIEDIIGERDKIVVHFVESGKYQGEFEGAAPTGKEVIWLEMAIFRVVNKKIIEGWTLQDGLNLMQHIGVIPLPE